MSCNISILRVFKQTLVCRTSGSVSAWIEDNLEGGKVVRTRPMGGSSWSSACVYETERGEKYFVKEARLGGYDMFKAEAAGLQALHGKSPLDYFGRPTHAT